MARKNKYNAKKVKLDGFTFDSQLEAKHYWKLREAQKSGKISDLKIHPKYPIIINKQKICDVVLDFEYIQDAQTHYVDVKGFYTSESKLRHKLLKAVYGHNIEIWK